MDAAGGAAAAAATAEGGAGDAGAGAPCGQQRELQAVLLVQQLVLFAPQAVAARRHVPLLRQTLLSQRPGGTP